MVAEEDLKKTKTPTAQLIATSQPSRKSEIMMNNKTTPQVKKKTTLRCTHCNRYGHLKTSCRFLKRKLHLNEKELQKELQETLLENFCSKLERVLETLLKEAFKNLPAELSSLPRKIDKLKTTLKGITNQISEKNTKSSNPLNEEDESMEKEDTPWKCQLKTSKPPSKNQQEAQVLQQKASKRAPHTSTTKITSNNEDNRCATNKESTTQKPFQDKKDSSTTKNNQREFQPQSMENLEDPAKHFVRLCENWKPTESYNHKDLPDYEDLYHTCKGSFF